MPLQEMLYRFWQIIFIVSTGGLDANYDYPCKEQYLNI